MFQIDQYNSGFHRTTTGPESEVEVKWNFDAPSRISAPPVIEKNTLFLGTRGPRGVIYSLDVISGDVNWQKKIQTNGIWNSPIIVEDRVYYRAVWPNGQGDIVAIDAASGDKVWEYKDTPGFVSSHPTIVDNTLFIGTDPTVYAIDIETGDLKWNFETGASVPSTPAVSGGHVYFGSNDHSIYALDIDDGSVHWKYDTEGPVGPSSPSVYGDAVVIGSKTSDGSRIFAFDGESGQVLWSIEMDMEVGLTSAAFGESRAYIGSSRGFIHAFNISDCEGRWSTKIGGQVWGDPVLVDDVVYASNQIKEDGQFVGGGVYAIDSETGDLLWEFSTDTGTTSPVVINGNVFVGDLNGHLYALGN